MAIALHQILALVGKLDDSAGDETPRARFRRFLKENVLDVGQIRDYVEECLRTPDQQYHRALQDLVNYLGHFLGFEVDFGRYQGIPGQIGFDGHWSSSVGFHVVIEVKTTEVYAIKTTTLVGYVDALISEKRIPNWDTALGLYVVGRRDPEIRQVENSIVAEKRTHQLRIISVNYLLSLTEMMTQYDVSHGDILALLRPTTPTIDPVVDLMTRLIAERAPAAPPEPAPAATEAVSESPEPYQVDEVAYWLTPVRSDEEGTAEDVIRTLVGEARVYAFGNKTPGRRQIKPGDMICFYATATGVVAHAQVASTPEEKRHPKVRHPDKYPWVFRLVKPSLYLDKPVVIDTDLRGQLDAFRARNPTTGWAWFVQATRRLSGHDFQCLTTH